MAKLVEIMPFQPVLQYCLLSLNILPRRPLIVFHLCSSFTDRLQFCLGGECWEKAQSET